MTAHLPRRLALALTVVAAVGASVGCGGKWKYRSKSYELPEEAVNAQRADLAKEAAQVAPVLKEKRLGGRLRVAILAEPALRAALYPKDANLTADQFFAASMMHDQSAGLVEGLKRAQVFDEVEVVETTEPTGVLFGGCDWLLLWPTQSAQQWVWTVGAAKTGAPVTVGYGKDDAASSERCDRFAYAVQAAGAASVKAPPGGRAAWVRALWPRAAAGSASCAMPGAPFKDGREAVSQHDGLEYSLAVWPISGDVQAAMQKRATEYMQPGPGRNASRSLQQVRGTRAGAPTLTAFYADPDGKSVAAVLIIGTPGALVTGTVFGPEEKMFRSDVAVSQPMPERVNDTIAAFFDGIDVGR